MDDTSGFYKFDGSLLYGPNFVLNKDYELRRETKDEHTYPTDGWYWFETQTEAKQFFNISEEEPKNDAISSPINIPVPPFPVSPIIT